MLKFKTAKIIYQKQCEIFLYFFIIIIVIKAIDYHKKIYYFQRYNNFI